MIKRMFDILKFLEDHAIDHRTEGPEHKHSHGWISLKCPYCTGNPGYYLGVHIESGMCHCWRCGKKKLRELIQHLIPGNASIGEVWQRYGKGSARQLPTLTTKIQRKRRVLMPPGIVECIPSRAATYLEGRGFDAEKLAELWGLRFTGPHGSYKFRIIAPIYHDGRLVSYQGRDYSGKSELRYKACRQCDEARDHKTCLYGSWLVKGGQRAVVVEGVADAWRLGKGAVATFGIAYTQAQVKLLAEYKFLAFLFDGEEQAVAQRDKLAWEVKLLNPSIDIQVVDIEDGDPGELSQDDADNLMKSLLK